jgi:hypothetical protein
MHRLMIGVAATAALALGGVAHAQSGHFLTEGGNTINCTDTGTQFQCTGKVTGLGGTTFEIVIQTFGTAIVECENPGGEVAPGQDTTVAGEGGTGDAAQRKLQVYRRNARARGAQHADVPKSTVDGARGRRRVHGRDAHPLRG